MKFLDAYYEARRDGKILSSDGITYDISNDFYACDIFSKHPVEQGWEVVDKPKPQPKFKIYDSLETVDGCFGWVEGIEVNGGSFRYCLHFDDNTCSWFEESSLEKENKK